MKNLFYFFIGSFFALVSCGKTDSITRPSKDLTPAQKILNKSIAAHGGSRYDNANYRFEFRGKKYTFKNEGQKYRYTVNINKDGQAIEDVLDNNGLTRSIQGQTVELSQKQIAGITESLNSVIYFATLPHKLQDPAVNLEHKGTTSIKGEQYEVLQITFNEENGGTDHDDVFYYWVNQKTSFIDYLAYNYQVNNGGVRFRSAYNARTIDGIRFQDYVNYKAPVGTPLAELPILLEKDQLKKLSVIETEKVVKLK